MWCYGPEFTSRRMLAWSEDWKVGLVHIQPGRPMQNGHVESFHGRLRDECLNASWFRTLNDVRNTLANWRQEDNWERPHSSLGYQTERTEHLVYRSDRRHGLHLVGDRWFRRFGFTHDDAFMPWKEIRTVDQRLQFLSSYQKEEMSVTDLCHEYGISRPTAYKWIKRYDEVGRKACWI